MESSPTPPTRIYLLSGKCIRPYKEPPYPTDPWVYGLPKSGVTDEQYAEVKAGLKAFINRDDAITFAYHCNLASIHCPVFDREGGEWTLNEAETSRIGDDIN